MKYMKRSLDKWSHAKNKDNGRTKGLFSGDHFILKVHVCIQKVIISLKPSCKHNFINANLAKRLQVSSKAYSKHTCGW